MKPKLSYIILTAILVTGVTIAGCEGPVGPQGEQGSGAHRDLQAKTETPT